MKISYNNGKTFHTQKVASKYSVSAKKKKKITNLFASVIIKRGTLLNQIAINFLWIIVVQVKLLGVNTGEVGA